MIEREKAIKSVSNRRIEAPEVRNIFDYQVGDVIQIKADGKRAAGKIGVIIGVRAFKPHEKLPYGLEYDLAYTIKLSDQEAIEVSAGRMRFLRHGDEIAAVPDPEEG